MTTARPLARSLRRLALPLLAAAAVMPAATLDAQAARAAQAAAAVRASFAQLPKSVDWKMLGGLNTSTGVAPAALKGLDGTVVRVPGFVVPLDDLQEEGAEFLLVPYYGACIHTPPPPPNQMVLVRMDGNKTVKLSLFEPVWIEGRLRIRNVDSPYGAVGYEMSGMKVVPYASK
jgi:hypothetical protein